MGLPQTNKINIDTMQTLNNIKLELKTIVETESNDFSYYPSYVTAYGEDRYDEGYADGEAAGGGSGESSEWMPIEAVTSNLPSLQDLYLGNVDSLDIYWGCIRYNFSKEDIHDGNDDVIGYRFEWDDNITRDTHGNEVSTHVIHEAYLDENDEYPEDGDGNQACDWFDFVNDNLYGNIMPVMRNVTLEAAPQGSDYDYVLSFETLVSQNEHATLYDPIEEITENGIYPVTTAAGFEVNVHTTYAEIIQEYWGTYDDSDPNNVFVMPINKLVDLDDYENQYYVIENLIADGAAHAVGTTWTNNKIVLFDVDSNGIYDTYTATCTQAAVEDPNNNVVNCPVAEVVLEGIDETHTYFWVFYAISSLNGYVTSNAYVTEAFGTGTYYADGLTDGGNIRCSATIDFGQVDDYEDEETGEMIYRWQQYYVLEGIDDYVDPGQR